MNTFDEMYDKVMQLGLTLETHIHGDMAYVHIKEHADKTCPCCGVVKHGFVYATGRGRTVEEAQQRLFEFAIEHHTIEFIEWGRSVNV